MYQLGIIGVGVMGRLLLNATTEHTLLQKKQIILALHTQPKQRYQKLGFHVATSLREVFTHSEIILLAVKPQVYPIIIKDNHGIDFKNRTIISIAPGISIAYLAKAFPHANIIRAMPNTAIKVNQSVTTYATNNKQNKHLNIFKKIFTSIGTLYEVKEKDIDAIIPLNGSMPAYLASFIKAFIMRAKKYGIQEDLAYQIIVRTILGNITLMKESHEDIVTQINQVCSKGGTTIAGLKKLDQRFIKSINDCYDACVKRANELKQ